jgi:two-component SAPR family response regulator
VTDRIQGTVGFDSALVTCDVDDFDREARLALAEDGDDFWILDHARKVERLYADGPGEHLAALGEVAAERARELQALYVDCMIAAGEASLRLGKNKLAVRYAQTAHRLDDLREDAMILLVRALRASGRGHETADLYRTYSRATIDARGVPPSLAVRRAVEQAVGGGNGALPS